MRKDKESFSCSISFLLNLLCFTSSDYSFYSLHIQACFAHYSLVHSFFFTSNCLSVFCIKVRSILLKSSRVFACSLLLQSYSCIVLLFIFISVCSCSIVLFCEVAPLLLTEKVESCFLLLLLFLDLGLFLFFSLILLNACYCSLPPLITSLIAPIPPSLALFLYLPASSLSLSSLLDILQCRLLPLIAGLLLAPSFPLVIWFADLVVPTVIFGLFSAYYSLLINMSMMTILTALLLLLLLLLFASVPL